MANPEYESRLCQAPPIVLFCWNKTMFNKFGQRRIAEAPPGPITASYDRRQTKKSRSGCQRCLKMLSTWICVEKGLARLRKICKVRKPSLSWKWHEKLWRLAGEEMPHNKMKVCVVDCQGERLTTLQPKNKKPLSFTSKRSLDENTLGLITCGCRSTPVKPNHTTLK